MESLLAMMVPLALVWAVFAVATGRSLAPSAVMHQLTRVLVRLLKWLWRENPPRRGAGRVGRPQGRYRP